ncbi:nucleoside hydrolase [Natrialba swarupiae]|uniref:Nucleoside hydrolase n=1 Tax=Natrialba swarupiae TaxID=2448032 RepID=A0A5D5AFG4_9EURY|nr:nucleoside hydrolase [Natrialba swarupiae]TYT60529.1 nucleoside hydrolase [Natrialba swarupiae]
MVTRVHLDVDPGSDDAVMIAMALGHPSIEVAGMSTVGGNSTVDNTTRNALAILERFDRTDVPVARGAAEPTEGAFDTAEWIHGENGIRGDLSEPTTEPVDAHGAEFIVQQAREYGEDITIVAVGPMTNLAMALQLEPSLPEMVDGIYLMGGAATVAGNKTPMAEANFHNDPVAASRVIQSGVPHMVGLDATHDASVSLEMIETYSGLDEPYDIVGPWLDYPDEIKQFGGGMDPAIHDAAVVAHLIDPEVLTFESYHLAVETTDGLCRGAVVCDERRVTDNEPNAEVAIAADTKRFREVFEESIDALVES